MTNTVTGKLFMFVNAHMQNFDIKSIRTVLGDEQQRCIISKEIGTLISQSMMTAQTFQWHFLSKLC